MTPKPKVALIGDTLPEFLGRDEVLDAEAWRNGATGIAEPFIVAYKDGQFTGVADTAEGRLTSQLYKAAGVDLKAAMDDERPVIVAASVALVAAALMVFWFWLK